MVNGFPQTQVLGEGHRKEQPSIGHQAVVVEGDLNAVGVLKCSIYRVLPVSGGFPVPKPLS